MTDYISNINGEAIGGYITGGQWQKKGIYLASNISMNGNSTNTYAIDLPDDGCPYEIIGWLVAYTGTDTNGAQADIYIQNANDEFTNRFLTDRVRHSSRMSGGGTFRLILPSSSNRQLKLSTKNTQPIAGTYLFWSWYRRIGTND